MSLSIGAGAEQFARDYLVGKGLKFVENNYRCRLGEIDLVMRDGEYLVFVEVRKRSTSSFGGAVASVEYQKQKKLIKTATLYLMERRLYDKQAARFDVLGIEGALSKVTWIPNAFDAHF